MTKPRSFAPFIAAVLLLLPVLYVGSYVAMVVPKGVIGGEFIYPNRHYRVAMRMEASAARFFSPLEQIDRHVRPGAWEPAVERWWREDLPGVKVSLP